MIMIDTINGTCQTRFISSCRTQNLKSTTIPSTNRSRWSDDKLVAIPAIGKEIDWANRSNWPSWLVQGLNSESLYQVHLYQRIDPNSTPPYDWPYCANRHC